MKTFHFYGIDVSKDVLDIVSRTTQAHHQVANNPKGFSNLIAWAKKSRVKIDDCWFVFEYTGLYCNLLAQYFHDNGIRYSQVPALAIKRSLGITRGKSDKVDAKRIAEYAHQKRDTLQPSNQMSDTLQRIKNLLSLRDRLVVQRGGYKQAIKDQSKFWSLSKTDIMFTTMVLMVKIMDRQIAKMEKEILDLIESDETVKTNYLLLRTIPGVGFVLAIYAIVYTDNFTRFSNGRKFACFCGTAPFEHTSGTSIHGKTRVSGIANKKLKTLLDMAAKAIIRTKSDMGVYYRRRVAQGKNKMSTVNILRNKIILRMFSVISNQSPYRVMQAA